MEQNKLNEIMMQYKDAIPDEQVLNFKNLLQSAPDDVYDNLLCIPTKSTTTTLFAFDLFRRFRGRQILFRRHGVRRMQTVIRLAHFRHLAPCRYFLFL